MQSYWPLKLTIKSIILNQQREWEKLSITCIKIWNKYEGKNPFLLLRKSFYLNHAHNIFFNGSKSVLVHEEYYLWYVVNLKRGNSHPHIVLHKGNNLKASWHEDPDLPFSCTLSNRRTLGQSYLYRKTTFLY